MTIKQQGGIFGRNPTFNDLTVEGSVSVPPDSVSGNAINGGTATPSKIIMEGSGAMLELYRSGANANFGAIELNDTTNTGINAKIGWNANTLRLEGTSTIDLVTNNTSAVSISSTNVVSFKNTSGTTEMFFNGANLVMAAGRGIDFSATSGTGTSELFDDYEEGSFSADTSGLTLNYTFTSKFGRYTKVGDMVTAWFRYEWTSANTGSGDTSFGVLPFAATENGYVHITECTGNIAADQIHGRVISGTSSFKIYGRNNGSATQVGPSQKTIWSGSGSSNVLAGVAVYKA